MVIPEVSAAGGDGFRTILLTRYEWLAFHITSYRSEKNDFYVHIYIYTYIHACMHACIHTYIHTYIVYIFVSIIWMIYIYREREREMLAKSLELFGFFFGSSSCRFLEGLSSPWNVASWKAARCRWKKSVFRVGCWEISLLASINEGTSTK